jgi:hypothetical protein
MLNWAGLDLPGGDKYNGGVCKCGHSAMQHSTQAHMAKGYWQCWNCQWVRTDKKPYKAMLTALPCGYHKFVPKKVGGRGD